jgi:hypothetical protein
MIRIRFRHPHAEYTAIDGCSDINPAALAILEPAVRFTTEATDFLRIDG